MRLRGRWAAAALAYPATSGPEHTATTVVTLPSTSPAHTAQLISALASLATRHELVIVCGTRDSTPATGDGPPLVAGLRLHLPRQQIIAVVVGPDPHPHEAALVAELLNDGALPVVLTTAADPEPVARLLAPALDADQVVQVSHDRTDGLQVRTQATPPVTG